MESSYLTSAPKSTLLPTYSEDEVAFIGRSNCGKSSLLNALLGRRSLAKTSSTPGRTQMANFFSFSPKGEKNGEKKWMIVDLPGYGFSVAGKAIQGSWDELMTSYTKRPNLKRLLFLKDIRREIDEQELTYLKILSKNIPLFIVLTKEDKVSKTEKLNLLRAQEKLLSECQILFDGIFAVSSMKKSGIEALKTALFPVS